MEIKTNRILVTSFASNVGENGVNFLLREKKQKETLSCWKINAENLQSCEKMWLP